MEYFFNRIFYCMCNSWQFSFRLLLKNKNYREKLIKNKTIRVKPNGELDCSRFATMFNIVNVPTTFGLLCIILGMVTIPIAFFCSHKLLLPKLITEIACLLIVFIPIIMLDCLLYRKDKYKHYFTVFEKDSKNTRKKWNIITIFTLFLAVIVAILLFKLNAVCFPK